MILIICLISFYLYLCINYNFSYKIWDLISIKKLLRSFNYFFYMLCTYLLTYIDSFTSPSRSTLKKMQPQYWRSFSCLPLSKTRAYTTLIFVSSSFFYFNFSPFRDRPRNYRGRNISLVYYFLKMLYQLLFLKISVSFWCKIISMSILIWAGMILCPPGNLWEAIDCPSNSLRTEDFK